MKSLTFVLMTCGELSEARCLKSIRPFKNEIEFFEVRNVYPQIKALNQMIHGVQTEYFIPLDADMVLYRGAWDRISEALAKHRQDPKWHSILFNLWDTLTEKKILALKLLRTKVMKVNPFAESATPDVEHYGRLTRFGYTCIHEYLGEPIGDHVVSGKKFCYFKFRDLYQTYRSHNFEWDSGAFMGGETLRERAKAHFDFFIRKWAMTKNRDYLYCLAGMMDGILSPVEHKSKTLEKDDYKVKSNLAIDEFTTWYMSGDPKCHPELLLF